MRDSGEISVDCAALNDCTGFELSGRSIAVEEERAIFQGFGGRSVVLRNLIVFARRNVDNKFEWFVSLRHYCM